MIFFNTKKRNTIGLDISDHSLKAAQFANNGSHLKLQALSRVNLPQGVLSSGVINDSAELKKRIKTLLSQPIFGKFSTGQIVMSLPETKTFIKLLSIKKNPNHLEKIVEAEMEKHLPYDLKEVYFDWQRIRDYSEYIEVLVGAVPRLVADQYALFVDDLGYELRALEVEAVAICRAVIKEKEASASEKPLNYLLIDIGAARSSVIVYSGNSILFTLSFSYNTTEMIERISQTLRISLKDAYRIIMQTGRRAPENEQLKSLWQEEISLVKSRVAEALDYYQINYSQRGPINICLLCGGGSNLYGLKTTMEDLLSCKVGYANILANTANQSDFLNNIFHDQGERSLEYATAVGLALLAKSL